MIRRRLLFALGAMAVVVGVPPALAAQATAAQPVRAAKLILTSQTPWVGTGGEFVMGLRISPATGLQNLEIVTAVHEPVATRSEFDQTVHDRINSASITRQVSALASLAPDAQGQVAVPLRIQDPAQPRDSSRLTLGREDGVHPVRVELRPRGGGRVLDGFTTHLVHLPDVHSGAKLGTALVLPIHSPPALNPEDDLAAGLDDLTSLIQGLDAVRAAPIALAPSGATLTTLAASTNERATPTLAGLRRVAAGRTIINTSYVPVNLPSLRAAGLDGEADDQINQGPEVVANVLQVTPDPRLWLADEGLDQTSLNDLTSRGVQRVIATADALEPVPDQKFTLTRPFRVATKAKPAAAQALAIGADPGLASHLDNSTSPVLQANRLLADLAVVYLDRPGADQRGVLTLAPRDWKPSRQFLETLLGGLNQNPIVEALSVDQMFTLAPAKTGNGAPMVRTLVAPRDPSLTTVGADIKATRRRLDALASILGPGHPGTVELDGRLLMTQSSYLRSAREREQFVKSVERGIDERLDEIEMPEGRSITLTSRRGEIPVTFQNRTGSPARVVIRVQSDKLAFPKGTTQTLDLVRLNTTQRFAVESRTSGAFPVRITMESPDGNLVIGRARLTVRSTAASGVSLVVSLGAALFLALWWGRQAFKGRRSTRRQEESP